MLVYQRVIGPDDLVIAVMITVFPFQRSIQLPRKYSHEGRGNQRKQRISTVNDNC